MMTPHTTPDRRELAVDVDPTDTVLDSVILSHGRTGAVWQVTNDDPTQVLACRLQLREGPTAEWVDVAFTDELSAIGPETSKRAMWRLMTYEVRLVGTASGAGLSARLWRNTLFGVQPT